MTKYSCIGSSLVVAILVIRVLVAVGWTACR